MKLFVFLVFVQSVNAVDEIDSLLFKDVNIGKVQSGEIVYASSEFVNSLTESISIYKIQASCSCIEPMVNNVECPAKSVVFLPLRIDTERRVGDLSKRLRVFTNKGIYYVLVKGRVLSDVMSAPSRLVWDGISRVTKVKHFYIWSFQKQFEIVDLEYDRSLFQITVAKEKSDEIAKKNKVSCSYDITVSVINSESDRAVCIDGIRDIKVYTDLKERPVVRIETQILANDALVEFSPKQWIARIESLPKEFVCVLRDGDVKVDEITCSIPDIKITWKYDEGDPCKILVTLMKKKRQTFMFAQCLFWQSLRSFG